MFIRTPCFDLYKNQSIRFLITTDQIDFASVRRSEISVNYLKSMTLQITGSELLTETSELMRLIFRTFKGARFASPPGKKFYDELD